MIAINIFVGFYVACIVYGIIRIIVILVKACKE